MSNQWSCIKKYTYEEYLEQSERDKETRGFLANETTPERVGETNDET
jgi:hypothetical protein